MKLQEIDCHSKGFKEEIKISNQRHDGLQLQMQQSRPAEAGTRERKSRSSVKSPPRLGGERLQYIKTYKLYGAGGES